MNAAVWLLVLFLADGSMHASAKERTLIGCVLKARAAELHLGDSAICFNVKTKETRHILDGE
jgi:hypothetical protein